jgi:DNA-binding NarL/FixJ family response regulator
MSNVGIRNWHQGTITLDGHRFVIQPHAPVLARRAIPQSLTPRKHEVLALVPGGLSKKEEGRRLGSARVRSNHIARI